VEPDPSIAISGAYNDVGATIFPNAKNIVLKQLSSSTFHRFVLHLKQGNRQGGKEQM
jgi:hypothetical protein